MKPFKRPRLANTPGNADTTDAPMFAKPYASIPAPSRQGSAVGRSVSSKSENTGSHATTSTFSGIASPPRAIHDRALNELGQVTQPLKEPVRFRKQAGTDEDIGFVFRHVSRAGDSAMDAEPDAIALDLRARPYASEYTHAALSELLHVSRRSYLVVRVRPSRAR